MEKSFHTFVSHPSEAHSLQWFNLTTKKIHWLMELCSHVGTERARLLMCLVHGAPV